ncbi:unnamed protein product, partial [Mesorhabditis spiculigera]
MTLVNSDPSRMNLSFSGCGFLCLYHGGVAAAIKEYAPQLIQENTISGASAGAIVAAALVTNVCISQATSTMLRIVREARSSSLGVISPNFDLMGLVREEIKRYLPPDAYIKCSARLKISVTRWSDKKNVILDDFSSNDELVDAITCSCFIPGVCGVILPTFRGEKYLDGGFSDNLPQFDDHTVTVSPFSGESDICPPDWESASFFGMMYSETSIRFTTMNLFRLIAVLMPPTLEDCTKMCLQGFSDTVRFLTKNSMAPCIKCLTIQTNMAHPMPNPPPSQASMVSNASSSETGRAFSPPIRSKTRTANHAAHAARRKLDSECDTCGDSEHMHNAEDLVFPSIIQRTFDEARKAEETFLKWLCSFWVIKCTRMAFGISKYPLDVMILFAKRITSYIRSIAIPQWLYNKFAEIVDLIYQEIDKQRNQLSAKFSCQLAVTQTGYELGAQISHKEHFGEIELNEDARRELAVLREKEKKLGQKKLSRTSRSSRTSMDQSDSRKASVISRSPTIGSQHAEEDSISQAIEYTNTHDAVYAFHYVDENNKVRNVELFNMDNNQLSPPLPALNRGEALPSTSSLPVPIIEKKGDENDSGLSVEESAAISKRDACCSPVRHLSLSRTRGSHQKRGAAALQPSRKSQVVSVRDLAASSDSDGEAGETFFVPRGRQRTTSLEYEGDPEQSDNEPKSS